MKLSMADDQPANEFDFQQPTLPLSALEFDESFNARHNGKTSGDALDALAANLRARGVRIPLLVYPKLGGRYAVSDGGRRLACLQRMRDAGEIGADFPVPVKIEPREYAEGEARATSLEVNLFREPLHPVDAYEAFAACIDAGMSEAGVAERYAIDVKGVRKRLALARLAPEIREAWRAGELDDEVPEEVAAAFTVEPDHKKQVEVFRRLTSSNRGIYPELIRRELKGDSPEGVKALVAFVGRDNYEAAGGAVTVDLFEDNVYVSDFPKLTHMAYDRLDAKARELRADGWAWAHRADEIEANLHRLRDVEIDEAALGALETDEEKANRAEWRGAIDAFRKIEEQYGDDDVTIEQFEAADDAAAEAENAIERLDWALRLRAFDADPELKKTAGCVLSVGRDGSLMIDAGKVMPAGAKSSKAKAGEVIDPATAAPAGAASASARPQGPEAKPKNGPAGLSAKLFRKQTEALTLAAQDVLAERGNLALAVAVAALDSPYGQKVATLNHRGLADPKAPEPEALDFGKRLEEIKDLPATTLMSLFARHVARTLDATAGDPGAFPKRWPTEQAKGLIKALPGAPLLLALRARFNAEEYFKGCGKTLSLKALEEMEGADGRKAWAAKKAAEIGAYAAAKAAETGWLPPELRVEFYDGPQKPKKARGRAKKAATGNGRQATGKAPSFADVEKAAREGAPQTDNAGDGGAT